MDILERAAKLREEADIVMEKVNLAGILRPYGKVSFVGSYLLDVMVYPDIDLYIPKISLEQIFEIGARFALSPLVTQVVFEKSNEPTLPGGLYVKPRIQYGDWGRPWKIDIWSLEEAVIAQKMEDMQRFKHKMTPHLREQIIRYKYSLMTPAHRTPIFSGYFTYRAFLDESLTDFEQVTRYLVAHGVDLENASRE
jgi:hypothetical protein